MGNADIHCLLCRKMVPDQAIVYTFSHFIGAKEHRCFCVLCPTCISDVYGRDRTAMNALLYAKMEALDHG